MAQESGGEGNPGQRERPHIDIPVNRPSHGPSQELTSNVKTVSQFSDNSSLWSLSSSSGSQMEWDMLSRYILDLQLRQFGSSKKCQKSHMQEFFYAKCLWRKKWSRRSWRKEPSDYDASIILMKRGKEESRVGSKELQTVFLEKYWLGWWEPIQFNFLQEKIACKESHSGKDDQASVLLPCSATGWEEPWEMMVVAWTP